MNPLCLEKFPGEIRRPPGIDGRRPQQLTANEAHAALTRFVFRNRATLQIAGTPSGGERLRAGRPQAPFLLLLDEPTNHLDLAPIEELENALSGFDGALITISHDQAFLQAIEIEREIVL